jgi:hypothetical protein
MSLTDHQKRQIAGRWAKRWPKAMQRSPYLTDAERAACVRRVRNAARERRDAMTVRDLAWYRGLRGVSA